MEDSAASLSVESMTGLDAVQKVLTRLPRRCCHQAAAEKLRLNPLGIQMLSSGLHRQIFGGSESVPDMKRVAQSIEHLKKHQLWGKGTSCLAETNLKLPKLLGKDIKEHFRALGDRYSRRYRELAEELVAAALPDPPLRWEFRPGWTRYTASHGAETVDFPKERGLVLDVEVCMQQGGHFPTLATAASTQAWYSWCSDRLAVENFSWSDEVSCGDLIPLEVTSSSSKHEWQEILVIGHNVAFDRSFVREQYYVDGTRQRFLDTMSLHTCVSGQTGEQRNMAAAFKNSNNDSQTTEMAWMRKTSPNNLVDVYKLYCGGKPLDKDPRNVFVKGSLQDVRDSFQDLTSYCSRDVQATHRVLQKVLPLFFQRFPHPVSLAGMLEMSVTYLPVNGLWERYLQEAHDAYEDKQRELKIHLTRIADNACSLQEGNGYLRDPWLWDLDWSTQEIRFRKPPKEKKKTVEEADKESQESDLERIYKMSSLLYKKQPFMPGYPKWYRNLCTKPGDVPEESWQPGPVLASTQMRCMPKLMRLTWDGYPLHYDKSHGWGYLVPGKDDRGNSQSTFPYQELVEICRSHKGEAGDPLQVYRKEACEPHVVGPHDVGIPGCWFFCLPHKDGPDNRVGNPLASDFLSKYSRGILQSHGGAQAQQVLVLNKMLSYWKNNHKRIESQMVVWLKREELPKVVTRHEKYEDRYGAILPRLVPSGTVTRRAVEPTWLTASNAYEDRIGSELKSMVQSPPGYHFVGADVDSQELWIASVLGDSHFAALHGCTALGWMTLQGQKSQGTDMHSRVAQSVGITRNEAKVLNYGRIYGAGLPFAKQLLMQFNHRLSAAEAEQKARALYASTKGVRSYRQVETSEDTREKAGKIWVHGSESHMFNKLEEIATRPQPTTPVLGCRISRALEPSTVSQNFMTSRVNWVVQSSAVDFLHLMLVCMRWLMEDVGKVRGRFAISIHDEVRFLVASGDRYRAALALHITNLLVRSLFSLKLGIHDLPQSVAFFSSVDIDTVLRKEVGMDCKTPSNPHGLEKGHTIPPGEALDIYQVLEKVDKL